MLNIKIVVLFYTQKKLMSVCIIMVMANKMCSKVREQLRKDKVYDFIRFTSQFKEYTPFLLD